ncbi:unnamed protein product [Choristocarpus tenellus]
MGESRWVLPPWLGLLGLALLSSCGPRQHMSFLGEEWEGEGEEIFREDRTSKESWCRKGREEEKRIPYSTRHLENFGPGLECCSGGEGEGLFVRLTELCTEVVQASAQSGRPAWVLSSSSVLPVFCAFTANTDDTHNTHDTTQCHTAQCHRRVVNYAVRALASIVAKVPTSTAQAEGVKGSLVALKGCIEASHVSVLSALMPEVFSIVAGIPEGLKSLISRSKKGNRKAYTTARIFCQDVRAAAVACARTMVSCAGCVMIPSNPEAFMHHAVQSLGSPLLLADGVKSLADMVAVDGIDSDIGAGVEGGEQLSQGREKEEERGDAEVLEGARKALHVVVLPGAVELICKALSTIDRYSASAAGDVLEAAAILATAGGVNLAPYLDRLGNAVVGAAKNDDKIGTRLRSCLWVVRCLCGEPKRLIRETSGEVNGSSVSDCGRLWEMKSVPGSEGCCHSRRFVEDVIIMACDAIQREWEEASWGEAGRSVVRDQDRINPGQAREEGKDEGQGAETALEAQLTLRAILRSGLGLSCPVGVSLDMKESGLDSNGCWEKGGGVKEGKWTEIAIRLGSLAEVLASQVEATKLTGIAALGEEEVALLSQGVELLGEGIAKGYCVMGAGRKEVTPFMATGEHAMARIMHAASDPGLHEVLKDACERANAMRTYA